MELQTRYFISYSERPVSFWRGKIRAAPGWVLQWAVRPRGGSSIWSCQALPGALLSEKKQL